LGKHVYLAYKDMYATTAPGTLKWWLRAHDQPWNTFSYYYGKDHPPPKSRISNIHGENQRNILVASRFAGSWA